MKQVQQLQLTLKQPSHISLKIYSIEYLPLQELALVLKRLHPVMESGFRTGREHFQVESRIQMPKRK
jgi:hypothetical protein